MNLDSAIQQLEELAVQIEKSVNQVGSSSLADDKTPLGNALAQSKAALLFDNGQSAFDTIVFGDLNEFKKLNDTQGHEAGDIAIRRMGEEIQREFVETLKATAFWPNGDEFVILLRQKSAADFQSKVAKFKAGEFTYADKKLKTKMSFGLVVSDGKTSFSDLLNRAETACLAAKNQGDGVCIVWDEKIERKAFQEFREKCPACGSVNKCSVPKSKKPLKLLLCSFCGTAFP